MSTKYTCSILICTYCYNLFYLIFLKISKVQKGEVWAKYVEVFYNNFSNINIIF